MKFGKVCHSTPKRGRISASYLFHISANEIFLLLHQDVCLAASQDPQWLVIYAMEKCVFAEKLWFLSVNYDHTLVHVRYVMVRRKVERQAKRKSVLLEWAMIKGPINALAYTHIHTMSCMMSYNDEWGCDGLSLHSKFVHSVNNGPGGCPSFMFFLNFTVPLFVQILFSVLNIKNLMFKGLSAYLFLIFYVSPLVKSFL